MLHAAPQYCGGARSRDRLSSREPSPVLFGWRSIGNLKRAVETIGTEMPPLRNHMQQWLSPWQNGLSQAWIGVIGNAGPDVQQVKHNTTIWPRQVVYPKRLQTSNSPLSAPARSHIYRAFDNCPPNETRVVFIGQDPYPKPNRATGRAFEAGDKATWDQVGGITSLRRICQQLVAWRIGTTNYPYSNGWQTLKCDIGNGSVLMPGLLQSFNYWEAQGVLLLNLSLTATSFSSDRRGSAQHLCDHIAMWEPFVSGICSTLAQHNRVVFVLLGHKAQCFFDRLLIGVEY